MGGYLWFKRKNYYSNYFSNIQKFWPQMTFDPCYISDLSLMTWMFPMSRKLKSMFEYVSSYSYPPPIACEEWGGGEKEKGRRRREKKRRRKREGGNEEEEGSEEE